jgi:hypothetical protein
MSNNQRTLDQQPILMKLLCQNLSHHEIYKMPISEVWTEIQDLQNGSFITIRTCHINWIQRSWDPDLSIVQVELPKPYKQWGARETELLTAKDSLSRKVVQQNTHRRTQRNAKRSQIKEFYISRKKKICKRFSQCKKTVKPGVQKQCITYHTIWWCVSSKAAQQYSLDASYPQLVWRYSSCQVRSQFRSNTRTAR